jgi:uncharacterized protein YbjT (DUF2867 family)
VAIVTGMTGRSTPAPILVTGGTGTLGTHVVRRLRERGRRVRVLTRHARPADSGVEYAVGDLAGGTGLVGAVAGADVIVHCASASKGDAEATRNLVAAASAEGGRPHLVYISIVGVEGVRFGYFRTKLAAEQVVVDSGLPWTILRSTQFYDFVLSGIRSTTRFPIVPAPAGFLCQPIDVEEVADRLADLALGPPSGRVPDIGGPQVSTWADLVRQYLRATGRRRPVVAVPLPGTRAIRAGGLLVSGPGAGGEGADGRRTWDRFLAERLAR